MIDSWLAINDWARLVIILAAAGIVLLFLLSLAIDDDFKRRHGKSGKMVLIPKGTTLDLPKQNEPGNLGYKTKTDIWVNKNEIEETSHERK